MPDRIAAAAVAALAIAAALPAAAQDAALIIGNENYRAGADVAAAGDVLDRGGVDGGGELRLSLSSPFDLKDAQGFRCPLYPRDRVADVATMLIRLLGDCAVGDIRLLDGIHADRVAGTTHPLLFKPATIPAGAELRFH